MTSEDWMDGEGYAVTFKQAEREMRAHAMQTQEPASAAFAGHIFARAATTDEWEAIPLNSKAILEWLGY